MTFKEYFVRGHQLWKRLDNGTELVVTGAELVALVDRRSGDVLAHGCTRQVDLVLTNLKRHQPTVAATCDLHAKSIRDVTATVARDLNAALAANDGKTVRQLLGKAKAARKAA